jgi:formylglycine-generating enzyme required for sulfatase activity
MGNNPSWFSANGKGKGEVVGLDTSDFPVETVSWNDAVAFCKKVSELPEEKRAGRVYRLPTEAEWEYSCRGGAKSYQVFSFGNSLSSTQANFNGNFPYGGAAKGPYLGRTCKVGSYKPNGFGLFDMHGNIWQWCADWYDAKYYSNSPRQDPRGPAEGSLRVMRGGCWGSIGQVCRSAIRDGLGPGDRICALGVRLALVPPSGPG